MEYNFKNLVFEGGGVKGAAYVGVLDVMTEKGILSKIERVGGTSAGSIMAVLLGLGFSNDRIRDVLWDLDFNKFKDDSWGSLRDGERLLKDYGWYKGDYFREWIGALIKEQTGNSESTFADVEAMKAKKGFRSMYFIGTNLSTNYSEIFSYEHTPRSCVADAVRISMSIPLFFASKRSIRGDVYVDGGVLDNYPVKLFDRQKYITTEANSVTTEYYDKVNESLSNSDREISKYVYNKETLGFRLDAKEEISAFRDHAEPVSKPINNFLEYTSALLNTVLNCQESMHLHGDDWARTIYIDSLRVKATDFALTDQKKTDLLASGKDCTMKYFEWYDDSTPKINK